MKKCPQCGLINHDTALRCDCEYELRDIEPMPEEKTEQEESNVDPAEDYSAKRDGCSTQNGGGPSDERAWQVTKRDRLTLSLTGAMVGVWVALPLALVPSVYLWHAALFGLVVGGACCTVALRVWDEGTGPGLRVPPVARVTVGAGVGVALAPLYAGTDLTWDTWVFAGMLTASVACPIAQRIWRPVAQLIWQEILPRLSLVALLRGLAWLGILTLPGLVNVPCSLALYQEHIGLLGALYCATFTLYIVLCACLTKFARLGHGTKLALIAMTALLNVFLSVVPLCLDAIAVGLSRLNV